MSLLSWTKRLIGVCCAICFLLLVWAMAEFLRGVLSDPYVSMNAIRMMLLASFASGALLFGTAGLSLLTGKYQKNRKNLHRVWFVLAALAIIFFMTVWSVASTTP